MSDHATRAKERRAYDGDPLEAARLLMAQIREGTVSRDRATLWAYLGDTVAREVAGYADCCLLCNRPIGFMHLPEHCTTVAKWASELPGLMEGLPPREIDAACTAGPLDYDVAEIVDDPCPACNGTGTRTIKTPAARWLAVAGCEAAGRAVLEEHCKRCGAQGRERRAGNGHRADCVEAEEALDLCATWLRGPTEANRIAAASTNPNLELRWADVGALLLNPPTEISPGSFWRAQFPQILAAGTQLVPGSRQAFCDAVLAAEGRRA